MDAMREASLALRMDRLQLMLIRTVLVQAMEMLGEDYPAVVLQDYENPMPVSKALKYLTEAIDWTLRRKRADEGLKSKGDGSVVVGSSLMQHSMQS